jgi:hypothetical protein
LPSQNPSVLHVPAPLSAHCPSGSCPAGTSVQLPALPATAQDLHVPVHIVLQQAPCWQMPELQSSALAHGPPSGRLPQLPLLHEFGAVQSASVVQVMRHLPSEAQTYGSHGWPEVGVQVPPPLHRHASVIVDPVHDGSLQMTPAGYFRHAPAPSQTPSVPHEVMPWSSHSLRGSVPTSAGRHVPRLPWDAQVWQPSVQAVLQQTPSMQKPLWQSAFTEQDLPSGSRTAVPPPSPP